MEGARLEGGRVSGGGAAGRGFYTARSRVETSLAGRNRPCRPLVAQGPNGLGRDGLTRGLRQRLRPLSWCRPGWHRHNSRCAGARQKNRAVGWPTGHGPYGQLYPCTQPALGPDSRGAGLVTRAAVTLVLPIVGRLV